MSKLSFRAKALDASKPMPILMAEELPDLPDYSAINRAVPQMPSGMEKEEECEHHLQRAICAGLIIPTPEVANMPDDLFYDKVYPANYKQPRSLIQMQPFALEQDTPDYDMDSEDDVWLQSQTQRLELSPLKFEEMMDRLEKSSGQTVVTLNEAKALLKEDDDLIIAVYDYWLNKRLKTQHPLILSVKTEHRSGTAPNNPYIAFRRRTEKMQTRKNRKNDESSYEKMLKLRRDLHRAVTLLEMVKRREKTKREYVHLTLEVFEKQYQAKDFSGIVNAEASAAKQQLMRPAFTQIFHNHYANQSWSGTPTSKGSTVLKGDELHQLPARKERRQYKRRKHKAGRSITDLDYGALASSDEESLGHSIAGDMAEEDREEEGQFVFRRNKACSYHMPTTMEGNWPWHSRDDNGLADPRYRFTLTSLSHPRRRCVGFARRRMGRGGRVILDRVRTEHDDFWRTMDFSIVEPTRTPTERTKSLVVDKDMAVAVNSKSDSECRGMLGVLGRTSDIVIEGVSRIKQEPVDESSQEAAPVDVKVEQPVVGNEERDEMLEFLRTVRNEWLHFRPKTPPPDYEPPCQMLPLDDNIFNLTSANVPFSLELQPTVDDPHNVLLDSTAFTSEPFTLDDLMDIPGEVPVTDTRQEEALVGCSKFSLTECEGGTGKTAGSGRCRIDGWDRKIFGSDYAAGTNGLISDFGVDVSNSRTKNNKLSYAYTGGVGLPDASADGSLSLHSSTHSLTLNSHSANIMEIPLVSESDTKSKLVNSTTEGRPPSPNNKNKNIVQQKNSLVMEVT